MDTKKVQWVLRLGVAGEFVGHGMLAIQGKKDWISWIQHFLPVTNQTALTLLLLIGLMDLLVALLVLIKPIRIALLWAAFWGFWTALVRPLVGAGWLDFIERWANWSAPLALLLLLGWPKNFKDWWKS